jgi:hypothetical protein
MAWADGQRPALYSFPGIFEKPRAHTDYAPKIVTSLSLILISEPFF